MLDNRDEIELAAVQRRHFLQGLAGAGVAAAATPVLAKAPAAAPKFAATLRGQAEAAGLVAATVLHKGATVFGHGAVERPVIVHSVRKSMISTLYGIMVDRGAVDLKKTIGDLGFEYDGDTQLTDAEKGATIEDLLMARSGVYLPVPASVGAAPGRPARGSHAPGSFFFYNNWDFNLLGNMYERITKKDFFTAFAYELAKPLGFTDFDLYRDCDWLYIWGAGGDRPSIPYYMPRLSNRDQAKIGQLVLQKGQWNGQQLVSQAWLDKSTSAISDSGRSDMLAHYGYLWWSGELASDKGHKLRVISAQGNGGHSINIIPELDLVAVLTPDTIATPPRRLENIQAQAMLRTIVAEYGV